MTLDSIFWIASCTKMICGLACMQLVEQGKLALDDGDLIEKLCPELKVVQVLQDDGTLVPKKNQITLRMLLTHTCTVIDDCGDENLVNQVNSWVWICILQREIERLLQGSRL